MILVVDVRAQAASVAAVVRGFATHRSDVSLAGVIFNRVGSDRHEKILRAAMALELPDIPILGALPRLEGLALPQRHLGLVQAVEHPMLERYLDQAAGVIGQYVDVRRLQELARPARLPGGAGPASRLPPLGQRTAVARDAAFTFLYGHILDGWRAAGAELSFFSPLSDDAPDVSSDAVYLPGGYPELHAGRLAAAGHFHAGMIGAAKRGATIFGECGGYMALGDGLIDAAGRRHGMCGLLPLVSSFAERKLHLGYRRAKLLSESPLGKKGTVLRGHEFHYATVAHEGPGLSVFDTQAADGTETGPAGRRLGSVFASFIHLIAPEDPGTPEPREAGNA